MENRSFADVSGNPQAQGPITMFVLLFTNEPIAMGNCGNLHAKWIAMSARRRLQSEKNGKIGDLTTCAGLHNIIALPTTQALVFHENNSNDRLDCRHAKGR